ncbi:MAG: hypothetical protein NTW94_07990 [Legionellales bacterium]|nr:hypothetical protein [Legionellales bacterium]
MQEWSKQKQQQPGKINVSSEIITRAAAVRSASAGGAPVSAAVSANGGGSSDSPTYTANAYKAATQAQWASKLSTQEIITIQEAIKTLKSEMAESVGNFGKSLKTIKVEALTELLEGCKITNKDNQEKSVGKIIQEIREKPEYKKVRAGIISHRTRDILEALEKEYQPKPQLGTAPRT